MSESKQELIKERSDKISLLNNEDCDNKKKQLQDDINFLSLVINSKEDKKAKWADMFKIGDDAEDTFALLCEKYNYKHEKSDKATDMKKHIDCYIIKEDNTRVSVDVKSIKKTSRRGNFDDSVQWIEFKNTYGGKGWLFGEANLIAFQFEKGFYLVNRESLVEYCNLLLINAPVFVKKYTKQPIPFYEKYTRHNCKDLIMKVQLSDVLNNCRCSKWIY